MRARFDSVVVLQMILAFIIFYLAIGGILTAPFVLFESQMGGKPGFELLLLFLFWPVYLLKNERI